MATLLGRVRQNGDNKVFDGGGVRDGSQAGDLGRLYMAVRYRQEGRAGVSRRGLGLAVHLQQASARCGR